MSFDVIWMIFGRCCDHDEDIGYLVHNMSNKLIITVVIWRKHFQDSRVHFLMAAFASDFDLKVLLSVRWHVLLAKACQTPLWPDNVKPSICWTPSLSLSGAGGALKVD